MTMSPRDLYVVARNAGFSKSAAITAGAIALAESGGNPSATHKNSNGSTDYGLWQINSIHSGILAGHQWQNPPENAKMAYVISNGGRNWLPWVTYKNGSYRVYVGRMRDAANGKDTGAITPPATTTTPDGGGSTGATIAPVSLSSSATGLIGALSSPGFWLRLAMILAGGLLMLLTLALMLGRDVLNVKRTVGL